MTHTVPCLWLTTCLHKCISTNRQTMTQCWHQIVSRNHFCIIIISMINGPTMHTCGIGKRLFRPLEILVGNARKIIFWSFLLLCPFYLVFFLFSLFIISCILVAHVAYYFQITHRQKGCGVCSRQSSYCRRDFIHLVLGPGHMLLSAYETSFDSP